MLISPISAHTRQLIMRLHVLLFFLVVICGLARASIYTPCKMSFEDISKTEWTPETQVLGMGSPFPLMEISKTNPEAGCRCKIILVYEESEKKTMKDAQRCFDERWLLLEEIVQRLKEK